MEELATSEATPLAGSSSSRDTRPQSYFIAKKHLTTEVHLDPLCRYGGKIGRRAGASAREEQGRVRAG
jgi:hypothetical protein